MKVFFAALLIALSFFSCAPNNVTIDNSLGNYFKEANAEGCFATLDNGSGEFTIYNLPRYRDSAFSPGSTFDLVTALVGLQTGVISSDNMVIKWDSIQRPFPEWNQDLRMYDAFRFSAVPYFQEAARRIGHDTMQHWLDSLSYGTKKIRTAVDSFWLDGSLKITPDEELGLVKRLYFGQLPFFKVNQEMIKHAMIREQNSDYTWAYEIGWGTGDSLHKKQTAWAIGWVEKSRQPHFFVLNLDVANSNFNPATQTVGILKTILQKLQLLPGK